MTFHQYQQDGIEVVRCLTSQYTSSPSTQFLLPITQDNFSEAIDRYRNAKPFTYAGLSIRGIEDISFLSEFPLTRYLSIHGKTRVDMSSLASFDNLFGINVMAPHTPIDFSWFPRLEVFWGDWHPDNLNLGASYAMHCMVAWHFKPNEANLTPLANLRRLQRLRLIQTNLTSLDGIQHLEDLFELELAYAPKLDNLQALAHRGLPLRELEFDTCKRLSGVEHIASLNYLRKLNITNCPPMPDLKWTKGMDRLNFFSFINTNVIDGDLSPLLNLPNLRYAGSKAKRHYKPHIDEVKQILTDRYDC